MNFVRTHSRIVCLDDDVNLSQNNYITAASIGVVYLSISEMDLMDTVRIKSHFRASLRFASSCIRNLRYSLAIIEVAQSYSNSSEYESRHDKLAELRKWIISTSAMGCVIFCFSPTSSSDCWPAMKIAAMFMDTLSKSATWSDGDIYFICEHRGMFSDVDTNLPEEDDDFDRHHDIEHFTIAVEPDTATGGVKKYLEEMQIDQNKDLCSSIASDEKVRRRKFRKTSGGTTHVCNKYLNLTLLTIACVMFIYFHIVAKRSGRTKSYVR
jgi:hypothetical protein